MNRLPHTVRVSLAVVGAALGTVLLLNTRAGSTTVDGLGSTSAATQPAADTVNGSFTGPVISTQWGPVQVKITLTNGTLSDVSALLTPSSHRKSVTINQRATPVLRQEALRAQSSDIDTVSGATVTSDGYRDSLQAALDAAAR